MPPMRPRTHVRAATGTAAPGAGSASLESASLESASPKSASLELARSRACLLVLVLALLACGLDIDPDSAQRMSGEDGDRPAEQTSASGRR